MGLFYFYLRGLITTKLPIVNEKLPNFLNREYARQRKTH